MRTAVYGAGAARTNGCVTVIAAAMNEPGRVTRTQRTGAETRVQATPGCYIVGDLEGAATQQGHAELAPAVDNLDLLEKLAPK